MRDCPVYRPGLELFVLRRAHAEYPIGGVVAQTLGAEIRQRAQALDSFRESEARFLRGDQEAEETRWKEEDYMG